MSDAKNTKASSSDSKSSTSKKKETPDTDSSGGTKSKSSSSTSGTSSGGGKSTRESIGGAKDVHYGYFSSVRTPEYRSGWEAIWGKKKLKGGQSKVVQDLEITFEDLPDDLRNDLTDFLSKKLRRNSNRLHKMQNSGKILWNISVRVDI